MGESTTTRFIKAPRSRVYSALVDGQALSTWLCPEGATSRLHECVPEVGGHFRMEITHAPGPDGTRLFDLVFVEMRPDEAVVWRGSFVSDDPVMRSEMQLTFTLEDEADGTRITLRHEGIPESISIEDNERGSASSLSNLARLVERGDGA
ncbi:SRPBCC domain-containing protein [Sorangium sp. So ce1128]